MPDTDENRAKIVQFVAQEIELDGKIPHARAAAVELLIEEAKRRARAVDDVDNALTLRLRDLGGVVRMAGDLAVMDGSPYIETRHMEVAIRKAVSVEDQIIRRYKSYEKALEKDLSSSQRMSQQGYSSENIDRSYM